MLVNDANGGINVAFMLVNVENGGINDANIPVNIEFYFINFLLQSLKGA